MGAYVNTTVGLSDTLFEVFHTDKSSNGAAIKIAFSAIETEEDVIEALSKVLRVAAERISVLTIREILITQSSEYDGTIMNDREYVFECVVGPNPEDDSVSPLETL